MDTEVAAAFKNVDKRFRAIRKSFDRRVTPLEKYIFSQQAVEEAKKKGAISISGDVLNIIKWLILIIATILGVKLI